MKQVKSLKDFKVGDYLLCIDSSDRKETIFSRVSHKSEVGWDEDYIFSFKSGKIEEDGWLTFPLTKEWKVYKLNEKDIQEYKLKLTEQKI